MSLGLEVTVAVLSLVPLGLSLLLLLAARDRRRLRRWMPCLALGLGAGLAPLLAPLLTPSAAESAARAVVGLAAAALGLASALAAWSEQALPPRRRLQVLAGAGAASLLAALAAPALAADPARLAQGFAGLLLLAAAAGFLPRAGGGAGARLRSALPIAGLLAAVAGCLGLAGLLPQPPAPEALVPLQVALLAAVPGLAGLAAGLDPPGGRDLGDGAIGMRRAEAELRRLQGRLESAIVSMEHGFALYDEADRLVIFNEAYHRFVPGLGEDLRPGMTFEEILGRIWDRGAYEGSGMEREAFVRRRLEAHRRGAYKIVQPLAGGTILQVTGMPTEEGGRVILLSDITGRRRRERVLETLVRRPEDATALESIAEAAAIACGFAGAGIARRLEDGRVELVAWQGAVAPARSARLRFNGPGSRSGDPLEEFVGRDAGGRFAGCELIGTSGAEAYFCRRLELQDGTVIGFLIALDDRPHDDSPVDPELLRLVARGASLELRRLQADEALRLSEKRFRDIAEINSDWIWETDAEHRYTYLSPRFPSVTGIPVERVLGLTRLELARADASDPAWQAHLADLAAHRDIREFVYSARLLDDDSVGRYRITAKALFDAQGGFVGYRGTANDITEIVAARAAAETLRLQLEAAVASLPDGFALLDAEDRLVVCNDVYRQVSPTMSRVTVPGASLETIVRAAVADGLFQIPDGDAERFVAERVARHRETPYRMEVTYTDGRVARVSGARTPDGGSVLLWTDIGEHVRRERVLSILVESRTRGRDLLEAASEALQVGLGFRWAGVAHRAVGPGRHEDSRRAEVLAMWDGELGVPCETFDYALDGTPCDRVYAGEPHCFWPRDVAARFPRDEILSELGAEAYLGHLLLDGRGKALGHVFALHDAPVARRQGDDDVVQLVANAVTIELQRLEAAQERDRAAELLRIIFENVGAGITVVDRNLQVLGHNERFRELLQFPPELLATGSFEAMIRYNAERGEYGPGDVEEQVRERVELARRFEAHRFERQLADGRFIEVRGDPLPDGGFVTTYTEVTERRRIEDALRRSELRYRLISEMTSDLLYSFRIEADGTPVAEWFAGTLGEVSLDLGDHGAPGTAWAAWRGLFHPEDQALIEERDRRLLAGETSIDEVRMLLDDGRQIWVRLHGRPEVDPDSGRVVRVLGAAQDITERMQSEAELRSAKEVAELANRAKSEFLATMSHELRTPLNAIIGFSEVMAQELLGPLGDERYRSYSQDIRDSGTHLLDIINDILDVSKAEAGMLELAEEELALPEAVAASLRLIGQRAERGGVTLAESLPADLPQLFADPRRVKQILLNLLSNAVKFTPAGGVVSVGAWQEADGGLAVEVTDSGIGIAPEDLERVLEPFTQVDSGFNRRHEGTGLGLPLTKALVELHGGTLALGRSEQGGTRALVRFPAARARRRRAPPLRSARGS